MHILFLSTWFPRPPDNGSKIRVYHLLQALAAQHEVSLLSFAFATAQPKGASQLERLCRQVRVVRRNPFERQALRRSLRYFSPAPLTSQPLPEMSRATRQMLAQTEFDAVIASTHVMAAYALSAPGARVLEEHNSLTRWMWERYQQQSRPLDRLRCWASWQKTRLYEARTLRRFDLCTMVSAEDQSSARRLLPGGRGQVEIVPNGIDCRHNRPGLAPKQPYRLVYNGALTYHANYEAMQYFLAQIYPLIRRQVPQASLTITGSTAGVDLDGLQLDESVHLSGYVPEVRPLVAGSAACVVPIRQGGGTRLKILEAMALGTPVVATNKGAEGLEVTPERNILIADTPAAFAGQVVRLLRDPALQSHLAGAARVLVEERYDWPQIGRRFVELVESAVEHRGLG
ncbi:MAG: glycosyltransferase [Chloroflexia bacterium]|nr:glycosyltransferase [Chloroflexia bacterium]